MTEPNHTSGEPLSSNDAWADSSAVGETASDSGAAAQLAIEKEQARQRKRHWSMLQICTFVVIMAFLLQTRPDHRVQFRWGPSFPLPESCGSKIFFGVECPGCGLTRSFISLSRGDFSEAWKWNRVGWLLVVALLLQFPYRIWSLRQIEQRHFPDLTWPKRFSLFLIIVLIANWILKLCGI